MRIAVALVGLCACGDNLESEAVATACLPDTPSAALLEGPFSDPLAIPLPSSCVEGGLRDLPGRWWVSAPGELFSFGYPAFEGTCEGGFRRAHWYGEDPDAADGRTFQTWTDGTRFFQRQHFHFEGGGGTFDYATAFAACMRPNGTLATVDAQYDTDRGATYYYGTGERFAAKDDEAAGITLVGELPFENRGYNVAIDGDHAYMVGPDGFDVVDVSTPSTPVAVGHLNGMFNDVKVVHGAGKTIAYLAPIENQSTSIVDITIPANPRFVGSVPAYSHSVFVTPQTTPPRLYLGNYTENVPVYDITTPTSPVLVGSVPIAGSGQDAGIHDIHVDGTRIYADKTIDGVVVVDVEHGFGAPEELGRIQTSYSHATWAATLSSGKRIAIHGDEGMTGGTEGGAFLRVIDADEASPTFMTEIGRYQTRREVGIHNMIIVGDRAYIAYYQDGIRVIDLADPTQPREVAHYNTYDVDTAPGEAFEGALGLVVVGDLIYVADNLRGLIVLRVGA